MNNRKLIINIYNDSINPTDGGIQNTAYCFLESMGKRYIVNGLSKKIEIEIDKNNITEVDKFSRRKAIFWVIEHSNHDTWNVVLNCWMGIPALIAKYLKGSHYFVMAHGNDVYEISKPVRNLKRLFFKRLNKCIFSHADFVVCNSQYTLTLTKQICPKKKHYIIHPPCTIYQNAEYKGLDQNMVFSVGRIVERKGFQFVVEAMALLLRDFPNLQYYIGGDGPYREKLQEIINKKELASVVHLLGKIDDQTKVEYFQKCAVFAMPSIELENDNSVEGFGIVYLEANQFGKYVIGSNSGGIPDAILENVTGSIIEKVNAQSIASEISKVLINIDDYYKEEDIRKRKEWAEEHYADRIVQQYLDIMESII